MTIRRTPGGWLESWRRILEARSETDPDAADALEEIGRIWRGSAAGIARFESKYSWTDGDVQWHEPEPSRRGG